MLILDPALKVLMDNGVPLELRAPFIPGGLVTPHRGRRVLDLSTPPPLLLLKGTKMAHYTLGGILAKQAQILKASWVVLKLMGTSRNLPDTPSLWINGSRQG